MREIVANCNPARSASSCCVSRACTRACFSCLPILTTSSSSHLQDNDTRKRKKNTSKLQRYVIIVGSPTGFLPGWNSSVRVYGKEVRPVTVIAANREMMVGDTQCIHDDTRVSTHRKVHVVRDILVGYAGCMDSGIEFLGWCKRGMGSEWPRNCW